MEANSENQKNTERETENTETAKAENPTETNHTETGKEESLATPKQTEKHTTENLEKIQEVGDLLKTEVENFELSKEKPKETNPQPTPNQSKSRKSTTLSIKLADNIKEQFRTEAQNFPTQEALFIRMMENYFNPPQPEVKEVPKLIEVAIEKELKPGQHIVQLSEAEEKVLGLISINRMNVAVKSNPPGFGAVKAESEGEILRKSFFNPSRLFNLDNTFFTGLTKKDMK